MLNNIVAFFDSRYSPVKLASNRQPPQGLRLFIVYFVRQFRTAFLIRMGMVAVGSVVDAMLPIFVGLIVGFLTTTPPGEMFSRHGNELAWMAALVLIRPFTFVLDDEGKYIPRASIHLRISASEKSLSTARAQFEQPQNLVR